MSRRERARRGRHDLSTRGGEGVGRGRGMPLLSSPLPVPVPVPVPGDQGRRSWAHYGWGGVCLRLAGQPTSPAGHEPPTIARTPAQSMLSPNVCLLPMAGATRRKYCGGGWRGAAAEAPRAHSPNVSDATSGGRRVVCRLVMRSMCGGTLKQGRKERRAPETHTDVTDSQSRAIRRC